ncbi:hypothetical protein TCAL_07694 [Tigriopus californicus]|uniref:Uncharacterized protein n=1 Tax=Tigriopus californicus TaxID=6832 RepID=A0A553NFZ4_TIGCA|nr:uncharacterized protein LOC131888037 [Tigriopus californicus]TRY64360.1 hypothetical protein TCAL_07694 [Tigriopus californicus]|eukprot:TCALIF_07694-PA protein Name:"Protein of unknown function" AED:0.12 eAED:0.21 QI:29/0/0/1/1/0.75/4/0/209
MTKQVNYSDLSEPPAHKSRHWCCTSSSRRTSYLKYCIMITGIATLTLLSASSLFSWAVSSPLHASCEVKWNLQAPCAEVQEKILAKMEEWSHSDCPGTSETCPSLPCGQRCKYSLEESTANMIKGVHRTPAKDYEDDFNFELTEGPNGSCKVKGFSTSRLWYAILDFGTNYCNLWNLVDGAGFTKLDGFKEDTSSRVCTQYDSADCSRY